MTSLEWPQELMLVTNAKGQVCHITSELAGLLGRTRLQSSSASGGQMIEQLMAQPFSQLHRAHLQVLSSLRPADGNILCDT